MFFVLSILIVLEVLVVFLFIALGLQKLQRPEFLVLDKKGKIELRKYDDFVLFLGNISNLDNISICGSGSKNYFDSSDGDSINAFMADVMLDVQNLKSQKWEDLDCVPEFLNGDFVVYSFKYLNLKKGFEPGLKLIQKYASSKKIILPANYYVMTYGKGLLKNHEILVKL